MGKKLNPKIEYKIVTGKDIVRLYDILVDESEEYNEASLGKEAIEYGDMETALRYHRKNTPDYTIKISNQRSNEGTESKDLDTFITNQKQPIISISMSYYNNKNEYIEIELSQVGIYYNTSSIRIVGNRKWSEFMRGTICDIVDDMNRIPYFYEFYTKYNVLFTVILFSVIGLTVKLLFNILNTSLSRINIIVITYLLSLVLSFFISKIILSSFSFIEFQLNPEYTDHVKRTRKKISRIYSILTFVLMILPFILNIIS